MTELMTARLADRLVILERERGLGEHRLQALAEETVAVQQTLLRISGAIQVLREVLDAPDGEPEREEGHAPADRGEPAAAA